MACRNRNTLVKLDLLEAGVLSSKYRHLFPRRARQPGTKSIVWLRRACKCSFAFASPGFMKHLTRFYQAVRAHLAAIAGATGQQTQRLLTYAVVDCRTVVVELLYAYVADRTVLRAGRFCSLQTDRALRNPLVRADNRHGNNSASFLRPERRAFDCPLGHSF